MPLTKLLWSSTLFLLQRGTTGVTIFIAIWASALIVMLDGVTAVSYQINPFSGVEERHVRLDVAKVGFQFIAGAAALIGLSVLTFFVNFYDELEANIGLRVLFGTLPLLLMALIAYFMLQR